MTENKITKKDLKTEVKEVKETKETKDEEKKEYKYKPGDEIDDATLFAFICGFND